MLLPIFTHTETLAGDWGLADQSPALPFSVDHFHNASLPRFPSVMIGCGIGSQPTY
jgi:hypothetical protein